MYTWGGKLRQVPEHWRIPSTALLQAFHGWCLGDLHIAKNPVPPIRKLKPMDLGDDKVREQRSKRKALAELRSVMERMKAVRHPLLRLL